MELGIAALCRAALHRSFALMVELGPNCDAEGCRGDVSFPGIGTYLLHHGYGRKRPDSDIPLPLT